MKWRGTSKQTWLDIQQETKNKYIKELKSLVAVKMSKYDVPNPEDEIPCPYNEAHMIRAKRMQRHLVRCRKQHRNAHFSHCPFNHTHVVPTPELQYHKSICLDKARLDVDLAIGDEWTETAAVRFARDNENWMPEESEESWGDDVPGVPMFGGPISHFHGNKTRDAPMLMAFSNVRDYEKQQQHEQHKFRTPREPPKVLSAAPVPQVRAQQKVTKPPTQKPAPVFAYAVQSRMMNSAHQDVDAMSMRSGMTGVSTTSTTAAMLQALARGRGIGQSTGINPTAAPEPMPGGGRARNTAGINHAIGMNPAGILTSMGRGRGIKTPTETNPYAAMNGHTAAMKHVGGFGSENSDANSTSGSSVEAEEEVQKIKRIQKKLRAIADLEEKMGNGKDLNADEEFKLQRKPHIILMLSELTL